jgi:hypothetical protein
MEKFVQFHDEEEQTVLQIRQSAFSCLVYSHTHTFVRRFPHHSFRSLSFSFFLSLSLSLSHCLPSTFNRFYGSAMSEWGDKMSMFADKMKHELQKDKHKSSSPASASGSAYVPLHDDRDQLETDQYAELKLAIVSIRDRMESGKFGVGLFATKQPTAAASGKSAEPPAMPAPLFQLSDQVSLSDPKYYFGVQARCIAMESLDFVLQVLKECEGRVKSALPRSAQPRVTAFLAQSENLITDVKTFFYKSLVPLVFDFEPIAMEVLKCRWDPRDIDASANGYVDMIVERFPTFPNLGTIPQHVLATIWKDILQFIQEALVDTYSRIRTCNTEGRAQMSMDATTLKKELDAVTKTKANFGICVCSPT